MQRRDFVKRVIAMSLAAKTVLGQTATPPTPPSLPIPWMHGLLEAKPLAMTPEDPDAVAQTSSHFFSDSQMATLRQLCNILLPPYQGHPGALDAEAPEFLDFLISVSPSDRQEMYQAGLDRLNSEAEKRFRVPFSALQKNEADVLLRPWLRTWIDNHPPIDSYARFINLAHDDIRTATVNSEAWYQVMVAQRIPVEVGLYWYPIDPNLRRESSGTHHLSLSERKHSGTAGA